MLREFARTALLSLLILSSADAIAQVFDRVTRPCYWNKTLGATPTGSGNWALVGYRAVCPDQGIVVSKASFMLWDSAGNILEDHDFWLPDHESTEFLSVVELGTDTFLVSANAHISCDTGPFMGLLAAWHDGDTLWTRKYIGQMGFASPGSMAVGNGVIALLTNNGVLFTDLMGDSLTFAALPPGSGTLGLKYFGEAFFAIWNGVLYRFDHDGSLTGDWSGSAVRDIAAHPDSGYVVLAENGLQRLTTALEAAGDLIPQPGQGDHRYLHWKGNRYHLMSTQELISLDVDLNTLTTTPYVNPAGTQIDVFTSNAEMGLICGNFAYAAGPSLGEMVRTVPVNGPDSPPLHDIAVVQAEIIDQTYQFLTSNDPSFHRIAVELDMEMVLVNKGTLPVDRATLIRQHNFPPLCFSTGQLRDLSDLDLAPGDSVTVTTGPFNFQVQVSVNDEEADLDLCIWVADPDDRLDADRDDNEACANYAIPLSILERSALGQVQVHPNPFHDFLWVSGLRPGSSMAFQLLDAAGRQVHAGQLTGTENAMITLPPLNPGIYFLRVTEGSTQRTFRLVHLP